MIDWLIDWHRDKLVSYLVEGCLMALSAHTGYIVSQDYDIYYVGRGYKSRMQLNDETIQ